MIHQQVHRQVQLFFLTSQPVTCLAWDGRHGMARHGIKALSLCLSLPNITHRTNAERNCSSEHSACLPPCVAAKRTGQRSIVMVFQREHLNNIQHGNTYMQSKDARRTRNNNSTLENIRSGFLPRPLPAVRAGDTSNISSALGTIMSF